MAIQPHLKSSELIKEFNLLKGERRLDELSISRFGREAEKIRRADPLGAATLAGALASHRGDVAEMERQFQIAIRQAPELAEVHANYAICLFQSGYLTRAKDEMIHAHRLSASDLTLLTGAFEFAFGSGAFEDALYLAEKRHLLGADLEDNKLVDLNKIAQYLAEYPTIHSEIQRLEPILGEVMRESRQILLRVEFLLLEDEESEWLSAWWHVMTNPGEVTDLNWTLAQKLSEGPVNSEVSSRMNTMFVSATPA